MANGTYSPEVSKAVQCALHNIALLRELLKARDASEANSKLPPDCQLQIPKDIEDFYKVLKTGQLHKVTAAELLNFFDCLIGLGDDKGKPREWTP